MQLLNQIKGFKVKEFTATQFKRNSSPIYNEMQATGAVTIKNADRGDMVLMTRLQLDKLLSSKAQREVFMEMQA